VTRKTKRILRTGVVVAVAGSLATLGAFSAFTSQTDNPNNVVTAGTVAISDNDGGTALYNLPSAKPGDSATACIKVSYTGSVPSTVRLYTPSAIGALGTNVNLTVEAGTQTTSTFPSCAGFTPFASGSTVFNAALSTFPTTYAGGITLGPTSGSTGQWSGGAAVVYRVTATFSATAPDTAQGQTTGNHSLRWEAQS
jgi:hypothetical protein